MKTILVSLISEQTIPNVLLIKELEGIDEHIFITTEKMENERKCRSNWIIKATKLAPEQVQRIVVDQDSLTDIENELEIQVKTSETHFIINLTGGNKLMSLAAYHFFSSRCPNSKIFYIPVGPRMTSYEGISPNEIRKKYELKYRVNLLEYLTAYSVNLTTTELNRLLKPETSTQHFYTIYRRLEEQQLGIPNQLRQFRSKKSINVAEAEVNGLEKWLETMKFNSLKAGKLNKDEIKYLTGDWFEEYIYTLIKSSLSLDNHQIGIGIVVNISGQENELDVLFIRNNKLYLVECKTSVFDKETEKNILTETLYKAAALRKEFGLNVETMIFTLTERGEEKKNIRKFEEDRAHVLGIRYIFDGSDLADEQKLKEELQKI